MADALKVTVLALLAIGVLYPLGIEAQQPDEQGEAEEEITLVYEREVFTYRGESRRDPFRPLTGENEMGPRFEALSLRGIIYSTGQGRSVALIADADGRIYRVRVGDMVGNARVIEIGSARVVMAVDNFGTIRQEILELPTTRGTDR